MARKSVAHLHPINAAAIDPIKLPRQLKGSINEISPFDNGPDWRRVPGEANFESAGAIWTMVWE